MKGWIREHAIAVAAGLVAVVALLGVGVIVQAVMLHVRGWRPQWGNVAEWFGAAGAIATVLALVVAWRVYQADKTARTDEDTRREDAEQRRQAELISGWFINYGSAKLARPIPDGTQPGTTWDPPPAEVVNHAHVGLINASQVVIYDVVVVAICQRAPGPLPFHNGEDFVLSHYVEWSEERDRLAQGSANVLAPGWSKVELRLATASLRPDQLHLFFRDHQGTYWWRDHIGKLTKMTTPVDSDPKARNRQIAEALGVATDGRVGILMVKPLKENRAT